MHRRKRKSREIVSGSTAPFMDRKEAGRLLGLQLLKYQCMQPTVIGIPREGMVVAGEVARVLFSELDFVPVCRIPSPLDDDTSLGAMSPDGLTMLNEAAMNQSGFSSKDLEKKKLCLRADMACSCRKYRAVRQKVSIWHRFVILVDDGATSGITMRTAIKALRSEHPRAILVALPAGARPVLDSLAMEADGLVCLRSSGLLLGVDDGYLDNRPVSDNDVAEILLSKQPKVPMLDPHTAYAGLY